MNVLQYTILDSGKTIPDITGERVEESFFKHWEDNDSTRYSLGRLKGGRFILLKQSQLCEPPKPTEFILFNKFEHVFEALIGAADHV